MPYSRRITPLCAPSCPCQANFLPTVPRLFWGRIGVFPGFSPGGSARYGNAPTSFPRYSPHRPPGEPRFSSWRSWGHPLLGPCVASYVVGRPRAPVADGLWLLLVTSSMATAAEDRVYECTTEAAMGGSRQRTSAEKNEENGALKGVLQKLPFADERKIKENGVEKNSVLPSTPHGKFQRTLVHQKPGPLCRKCLMIDQRRELTAPPSAPRHRLAARTSGAPRAALASPRACRCRM